MTALEDSLLDFMGVWGGEGSSVYSPQILGEKYTLFQIEIEQY